MWLNVFTIFAGAGAHLVLWRITKQAFNLVLFAIWAFVGLFMALTLAGCYLSDLAGPEDQEGKTITIRDRSTVVDSTDPKPPKPDTALAWRLP